MLATTLQLCEILDCSTRAITLWVHEGMPVATQGGAGRGDESMFETQDVIQWLTSRAVTRATGDRPDARLKRAQAQLAEMSVAEKSGALVAASEIAPIWEGAIMAARADLLGMGPRLKASIDARYSVDVDITMFEDEIHHALTKLGENPPAVDIEGEEHGELAGGDESES